MGSLTSLGFIVILNCIYFTYTMANVVELTDNDFNDKISEFDTALVMFYAPWCGHCKKLKPEFENAASILKGSEPSVTLAKVDCTENGKETCNKFQVSGYPTLKIFQNGQISKDYSGPNEANGMVRYMESQVGPASKVISLLEEFDAFTAKDSVAIIGYFPKDVALKNTYLQLANKLRDKFSFAHTESEEVAKKLGVSEPVVQLFRPKLLDNKFEDRIVTYTGGNQVSELDNWIKSKYHGLVGLRIRDNVGDFAPPVIIAYYNVDYAKNPKGTNYWRNRILKVAKDYTGPYKFAISSKDDFQHELNDYGYDYVPSEKPLVLAKGPNKEKFVMKDEFSVEALQKFIKELEDGTAVPFLKSEEPPTDLNSALKVAVAKNFDDIVVNNGKDTLIEFYAPWCGHCKKLAPIFEKLAEKMKDEDVSIVKMDATANDVPSNFNVQGFPTLFWLSKDKKNKPIPYDGGRELKDFIKFIAEHATEELNGYNRKGKPKGDARDEL